MKAARTGVIVAVLAVGVVSFVFVRSKQGEGTTFIAAQRNAQVLVPAAVDRVVRAAPDPATHARARSAMCVPRGTGELHNPWRCTLRYSGAWQIQWTVSISADGSYVGTNQIVIDAGTTHADSGSITGCCIAVP